MNPQLGTDVLLKLRRAPVDGGFGSGCFRKVFYFNLMSQFGSLFGDQRVCNGENVHRPTCTSKLTCLEQQCQLHCC